MIDHEDRSANKVPTFDVVQHVHLPPLATLMVGGTFLATIQMMTR
jgi:hypothetical protein